MACADGGAWVCAVALLDDMMQRKLTPDCWAAGSAAHAVGQRLGLEAAYELLEKLRDRWQSKHSSIDAGQLASTIEAKVLNLASGVIAFEKPAGIRTEDLVRGVACLVSRLDHPTSGVLPLPLGIEGSLPAQWLQAQFAARLVQKEYLCLCEGGSLGAVGSTGTIDSPLQTTEVSHFGRHFSRTVVSPQGRSACTRFEVRERFAIRHGLEVMLVLAKPFTGRTHQIRVHLASIGRPLLGDLSYGLRDDSVLPDCPRLFLHCRQILLRDLTGKPFVAECPLPTDLRNVLLLFRGGLQKTGA
ncbi:rluC, partial [Symbiodinium sp. KB8]